MSHVIWFLVTVNSFSCCQVLSLVVTIKYTELYVVTKLYIFLPFKNVYISFFAKLVRRNNKKDLYLNTGWTTYVDYNGQQLVNALAELITAHELGHSWGADHDPDTDECNPAAISSGKYLMYTYSVSGYAENNGVSCISF